MAAPALNAVRRESEAEAAWASPAGVLPRSEDRRGGLVPCLAWDRGLWRIQTLHARETGAVVLSSTHGPQVLATFRLLGWSLGELPGLVILAQHGQGLHPSSPLPFLDQVLVLFFLLALPYPRSGPIGPLAKFCLSSDFNM